MVENQLHKCVCSSRQRQKKNVHPFFCVSGASRRPSKRLRLIRFLYALTYRSGQMCSSGIWVFAHAETQANCHQHRATACMPNEATGERWPGSFNRIIWWWAKNTLRRCRIARAVAMAARVIFSCASFTYSTKIACRIESPLRDQPLQHAQTDLESLPSKQFCLKIHSCLYRL